MELRKLKTFILLLSPFYILAQPTVNSNWVAQIGDEIQTVAAEEAPSEGDAGANVLWDFTAVTPEDSSFQASFVYVTSDTTQFAADFPSSNVCLFSPELGSYSYYVRDAQAWEDVGNAFENFKRQYSDPRTLITFPFTYQDEFMDDYAYTTETSGITIVGTGNVDVEADAYGTVLLPGATFNDVLRVKSVTENVDSTDLGLGIIEKVHTTTTAYIWVSQDHGGALASHVTSEGFTVAIVPPLPSDTAAFGPITSFSYDPSAVMAAVDFVDNAFSFEISPNPFSEALQLKFELEGPETMYFELQGIDGRVLHKEKLAAVAGNNVIRVTPSNLPGGVYLGLLYSDSRGTTRRLIKWDN